MKCQQGIVKYVTWVICFVVIVQGFYFWMHTPVYCDKRSFQTQNDDVCQDLLRDSSNDKEALFALRRRRTDDGCTRFNRTVSFGLTNKSGNAVVTHNRRVYYCPITKVGSTFWKRILTVFDSSGKYSSPFQLSLGQVKLLKAKDLSITDLKRIEKKGNSFLFVRDPYSRIFSGYENKIYHSNLMYWRYIGKDIVQLVRNKHDAVHANYGFDVTFPEFIKYLLHRSENNKAIDMHFKPMATLCDPCGSHIRYIGKMETFKEDSSYLISKLKKEFENVSVEIDDLESGSIIDTAKGRIRFLFETKRIINEIKFPFGKIMLRTWRDLQIRGYISKYVKFPYEHKNVDAVTKEGFIEEVIKALEASSDRAATVSKQREEALIQSYHQVPIEDMERLRTFLLEDCILFGYDDRPKKLFDRSKPLQDTFLYLDGLEK